MQVQVAETGPCSRSVSIVVSSDRVKQHLDLVFAAASQQVQMKGFRPGHVPRKVLEKRLGGEILREAKERLINDCFGEACRERELTPVGRANVDDFDKLELALGNPLSFVVRFDIKPNFKLGDVRGHQVDPYETAASDQDVDNALNEIANQKRAIKTVDGPAADGDFLKADLTFQDSAGQTVLERKNVQLNTRIPFAGVDAEAFAKAAIGAAAGATLTVELTFADNFEKEAVRGKPGKLQIHVHEVLRVQPAPIDDNLARQFEFGDLAALKEDLRQRISGEKERVGRLRQEDQVLEALLGAHSFDLPPSLVDEQQRASLQQFAHRLKQNGVGEDEVQKKLEEAQGEAQTDAQRRVKLFFLIESIARQEQIQITEADLTQELHNIAAQNNATPEQVFEYLQKNNQLSEMRLAVLERKVRDFLRENARVADKKG